MENSLSNYGQKAKGLFDQKGGTLGMVVLALGVVALIIFSAPLLVILKTALESLLGIIVLVGVISGILFLVFNKDFRILVGTLYMMAIRSIMGAVVKMNPIAILEDTIKQMYKRIGNVEDKMGKLNGVRLKFKDKIKSKKKELQECFDRKSIAEQKYNTAVAALSNVRSDFEKVKVDAEVNKYHNMVILEDRQSVRLHDITQEYIDLQESSENWYNTLSKIAEMAKLTTQDAENEVAIQKEKYEMVKDSHSAFRSAMSILKGDPDELALYNQAFEFVSKDIMDKVGEMDRVINTTGGMIDKMELDKEMYAIKGNDISKVYTELGIDALFVKMNELPSTQMNKLQVANMTQSTSPVLQKSSGKYFTN